MKTTFKFLSTLLLIVSINALLTSCDDEPDPAEREHDSSLFGEWIEYGGKYKHIADYYFSIPTALACTALTIGILIG